MLKKSFLSSTLLLGSLSLLFPTLSAEALSLEIGGTKPAQAVPSADNSKKIKVVINGNLQQYEQSPQIVDGVTLVPMRDIFESLGATVKWDDSTKTVTGTHKNKIVTLQVDSLTAKVDGKITQLEVAPTIIGGKTMIPARYVSESLGMYVSWDKMNNTNTVFISDDAPLYGRTKSDIQLRSVQHTSSYTGTPFMEEQSVVAPYKAGKLQEGFIDNGVKSANFARYLAFLPDDLVQDAKLNEEAQYGAVLTAAHNKLNHTPEKPSDMDEAFYKIGYKSTSSSNLHMRYGSGANRTNADFLGWSVWSYMKDQDDSNIDRVGHRRWILSPQLKKVGFGYAESKAYTFTPMSVFDSSRKEKVDYDFIGWPAKGYFPTEHFAPTDPWSVSPNSDLYSIPVRDEVNVKLVRQSDKKTWDFNAREQSMMNNKNYFNVDYGGFGGSKSAIIFRPSDTGYYTDSDVYDVTITGLKTKDGRSTELKYSVNFFNM